MKHLIHAGDLSEHYVESLINTANSIIANPKSYQSILHGKILATLFYEPSTRTRLSFESAMIRLGGSVIGFSSADSSSASKGESVADTMQMVSGYAHLCAIRHPKEGTAYVAASNSRIPVINAGDGGHQHPTQTLADLLTIHTVKGTLEGLTIGLCGDLKFGRTAHSLIETMLKYKNNKFILVSPKELKIPDYVAQSLLSHNISFVETEDLERSIPEMDILYMTRVQRERFFNEEEYIRLKDVYILNKEKLNRAKSDLAILHPLPRVNEIAVEIDNDPRAYYFKQAELGVYIRMALILDLLEVSL